VREVKVSKRLTIFTTRPREDAIPEPGLVPVCQATSAAPTYFKPALVGGKFYVDGGVLCNNPAGQALNEAETFFPKSTHEVALLLSVGCDEVATDDDDLEEEPPRRHSFLRRAINIIKSCATDTAVVHQDLLKAYARSQIPGEYFRFNPPGSKIKLDEYKSIPELIATTQTWIESDEVKLELQRVAEIMAAVKEN
jgi:patatin-like phospholipase/acyl hydrolase